MISSALAVGAKTVTTWFPTFPLNQKGVTAPYTIIVPQPKLDPGSNLNPESELQSEPAPEPERDTPLGDLKRWVQEQCAGSGTIILMDGAGAKNQYHGTPAELEERLKPVVDHLNSVHGKGRWVVAYAGDPYQSVEKWFDCAHVVRSLRWRYGIKIVAIQCSEYAEYILKASGTMDLTQPRRRIHCWRRGPFLQAS